jgi:hypothetical protein
MKKKSVRKKPTSRRKTLTREHLIDFTMHLNSCICAGMSTYQAFNYLLPFLEEPLKTQLRICIDQTRTGASFVESLCNLSNRFNEITFHRIIKMLILTRRTGASIAPYMEAILQELRANQDLKTSSQKLDTSAILKQDSASDNTPTRTSPVDKSKLGVLSLKKDFLIQQDFWKFLEFVLEKNFSLLIIGQPSQARDELIELLTKKSCEQILHFTAKTAIDFLIKMSNKKSTIGIIDSTKIISGLNQIELHALEQGASSSLVRNALVENFSFILYITQVGDHHFVESLSEIQGMQANVITLQGLFFAKLGGQNENQEPLGYYVANGVVPRVTMDLESQGFSVDRDIFNNE